MTADRWIRIATIAEQAIAIAPESRLEYVRVACDNDADLGRQVTSLLAHHQDEETLRAAPTVTHLVDTFSAEDLLPWVRDRFERLEPLGSGSFGNVYRAYDRLHRQWVALKVLRIVDPVQLDRFKQEFRKTTTIRHHNVVKLYELFSDGDRWFFTMELVDGVPLVDYITGSGMAVETSPGNRAWSRLRQTFEQLVEGVSTLHASGIVHGDLKPQNVVVAVDGRVVVLDFGLARDISQHPSLVAGTPAYMAPEQLTQERVAEAADWYSVGVLLYEALTGTVPFTGTFWDLMWKKQHEDARFPERNDLPEPLVSLCEALLQRQPDKRPSARQIRERLRGRDAEAAPPAEPESRPLFVGRQFQLNALREAFDRVRHGQPTAVHLHGVSGIGKSALIRRFLEALRQDHDDTVVLAGRCYETESVPFKALDEVVDGLTRYLGRLEPGDVAAVLPRELSLLTRVFPVLQKVSSVRTEQGPPASPVGVQELRQRALSALLELLERLATRRHVVLWIDDLQWGDFDSLRVLHDLQQPGGAPRTLLILSYRREDVRTSPVLQAVIDGSRPGREAGNVLELAVDELRRDEAHELADALCGDLPEAQKAGLVNETGGNPLFLHELARHSSAHDGSREHATNLLEMVQQRIHRLRPSSRHLVDVIAVAGQPVDRRIAIRAAQSDDAGAESQLTADFLIRASGSTTAGQWDVYHDTVREAVLGLLSEEQQRTYHARLARAFEADGHGDPERLVHHFMHAGIEDAAYRCALQAAQAAEDCLAFDQASSLFGLALRLRTRISSSGAKTEPDGPEAGHLWRQMANALANAGRTADAAQAYLQAADRAGSEDNGELRSQAVDQLMRGGQIDEGLRLLTTTLREQGMDLPRRRSVLLAATAMVRVRVYLRGLRFRERPVEAVPASVLTRIDRLWTVGATLTAIDPLLSSYLRGQHLLLALRAGEPHRISISLALEAIQRAMAGARAYPAARRILDRARELAVRSDRPYVEGMVLAGETGVAHFSGRVRDVLRYGLRAEEVLSTRCTGVVWELAAIRVMILGALHGSGQYKEHAHRLRKIVHDAEGSGDLYTQYALPLSAFSYGTHLAADDPVAARHELDGNLAKWARTEFDIPQVGHSQGTIETFLYEQRYDDAWRLMSQLRSQLRGTLILRIELTRMWVEQQRARCALGLYSTQRRPALIAIAEAFARDGARSSSTHAQGWGLLVSAAVTASRGNRDGAIAALQVAEEKLSDVGAAQYVAASRRRRGELMGSARGAALMRQADSDLIELGVTNPERMVARLVPGFVSASPVAS